MTDTLDRLTNSPKKKLYVFDSAVISLLPDVKIEYDGLRDASGGKYALNPVAYFLVEHLAPSATVAELIVALAEQFQIDKETARADVVGFLSELHAHRLVSIKQSFPIEFLVRCRFTTWGIFGLIWLQHLYMPTFPARRYQASFRNVVLACLEAHQVTAFLFGAALATAVGVQYVIGTTNQGLPPVTAVTLSSCVILLLYLGVLIGSAAAHELAHYWTAQHLNVRVLSVFVRMGVAGISHVETEPLKTAAIAAAGPITAIFVIVVLAVVAWFLPFGASGIKLASTLCCAVLGLVHLRSLTPLTAEGQRIIHPLINAYRRKRASG